MNEIFKIVLLGIVFLCTCVGCTNDPNSLSGIANVNGVPIEKGVLILTPNKGNAGPRVICDIVDGRFYATPITPGPNVAYVSVHKKPEPGKLLSVADIGDFRMYTVYVDLPPAGTEKFAINVVKNYEGEFQQNDADHQTSTAALENSTSNEVATQDADPDDSK